MSSIKISACIITYNHETYLRECLDGAINQNVDFDYEIVIGEDRSTDKTLAICKEYAQKYPKLIKLFIRERNLGMTGNWVNTIENCRGQYIALCEGDDYWTDPNKLQQQVDYLDNNPNYVGSFHNVIATNEMDSNSKPKPWRTYNKDTFNLIDTFSKIALFHTCSFVFRNKLFEFPEWFHHVKSADMSLFSIVASQGRLKLLPGNMGVYRKNDGGVTHNEHLKDYHSNRLILWNYVNQHYDYNYKDDIEKVITFHNSELKKLDNSLLGKLRRKFNI